MRCSRHDYPLNEDNHCEECMAEAGMFDTKDSSETEGDYEGY